MVTTFVGLSFLCTSCSSATAPEDCEFGFQNQQGEEGNEIKCATHRATVVPKGKNGEQWDIVIKVGYQTDQHLYLDTGAVSSGELVVGTYGSNVPSTKPIYISFQCDCNVTAVSSSYVEITELDRTAKTISGKYSIGFLVDGGGTTVIPASGEFKKAVFQ